MHSRFGPKPALALASVAIVAAAMLAPAPSALRVPDRAAERAWSAGLDQRLGPVMADCVRFEVAGHVAPVDLNAMLVRAGGDPRLLPRLGQVVDQAMARCRKRHAMLDDPS